MEKNKNAPNSRRQPPCWLTPIIRLAQGVLIGGAAILPGVSGGVMSVAFGVYQPLLALLSRPLAACRKYWRLYLFVGCGWALGFWFFASVIQRMFAASEAASVWLFIGLIAGALPQLFSQAKEGGGPSGGWLWTAGGALLFVLFILIANSDFSLRPAANAGWFLACGLMWGVSLVVPGLTMASVIISLGLYQPLTAGIAAGDLTVLLPMFGGILFMGLTMGRVMDRLLNRYPSQAARIILGFVAASTLAIIPLSYRSAAEVLISLAAATGGFLLTWWMERNSPSA